MCLVLGGRRRKWGSGAEGEGAERAGEGRRRRKKKEEVGGKRKGLDKSGRRRRRRQRKTRSLSLSFPHLLQVPGRAGHDVAVHGRVHCRLELVLVLFFCWLECVFGRERGRGSASVDARFSFHRDGLVFFFFFLSTLAFLALSVSRVLSSLIEQAHHVIHDGQTLTRRHEEKRERESRKETKAEE